MTYTTVSLSGGKDSTAMLLMMLEKGERVDEVIVYNTGMEFPEMYEHIAKLEEYTSIRFTHLAMEPSFEYYLHEHVIRTGKHKGTRGYGWPRATARWCTTLKTTAIDKHLKSLGEVVQCVGIAADERKRIRDKRYPLVEYGVTEADALSYCYDHGFTWGGLYKRKKRVSCWCCPLQSLNDLRVLRSMHPELWERLKAIDSRCFNDFRADYTLDRLEEKFSSEDKQMTLFDESVA